MKNLKNLGQTLSQIDQKNIFGGRGQVVERCCIRIPSQGLTQEISSGESDCNNHPYCRGKMCGCSQ